jgi:hypothetical protein
MQKRYRNSLEDLLYKSIKITEEDRIIVIFACDTHVQHAISQKGKPDKQIVHVIHALDLTTSMTNSAPYIDSWVIQDVGKFKRGIEIIEKEECSEQLITLSTFLVGEMSSLSQRMQACAQALTTVRYMTGSQQHDKGNLLITSDQSGLAHIVFSTVTGDTAKLEKRDIDRIGRVIMDVILNHVSIDMDDSKQVKDLEAEIEYKIVEALPDHMKAGDIAINMKAVLFEIRKFQGKPDDDQSVEG